LTDELICNRYSCVTECQSNGGSAGRVRPRQRARLDAPALFADVRAVVGRHSCSRRASLWSCVRRVRGPLTRATRIGSCACDTSRRGCAGMRSAGTWSWSQEAKSAKL